MSDFPQGATVKCQQFVHELEGLTGGVNVSVEQVLQALLAELRTHGEKCAECRAALEDLVETREALAPMKPLMPEAGPWFTARVMAAIDARENEIEERSNNVWLSVRRLAPRLAACATLLLVLGGSWAMELRHADKMRQQQMQRADSVFEGNPSTPVNYDIIASATEEQP